MIKRGWLVILAAAILIAAVVWFFRGDRLAPGHRPVTVALYFLRYDPDTNQVHLEEVQRTLESQPDKRSNPETTPTVDRLRAAIEALLAGPTPQERARGLHSEIPAGTRLRNLRVNRGIAFVDLSAAFESGGGSLSVRARVAQLLYTATQFPEIADRVRILIEGEARETITGEGLIVSEPLSRREYPTTL
ncbi:MAG: GerMN domain-containing protein [Limnochordales bacterium]|nr:GerMN domain-containing protein [Limnochordales bacterium]